MPLPSSIKELIARFDQNRESYSSSTYNETQLRQEFLNPFFEALGWDVSNKQSYAEAYKEVIHEDAVKIGTATKAPDYSFRVGGTRKFFVEAKKPFVNIKEDIHPAFQLRRYAWSAKLSLSVLTDFEEFAVYDCRLKPVKTDKASIGRILYIKYDEYEKRWEEIASIFSKEAVLKGSFDSYAETTRSKKGTTEVDDAFLADIESWRDLLARNIAIRNEKLSTRELNFAVQRTIDRIIFLRICEDRGIEENGRLQAHLNGENVYKRLCVLFREADDKYNSGLFHFREEKGRDEAPDSTTLKLDIDDKVLKEIIENLYYPESAYEFSVLPADILGQVYEQFLGKVIRLTTGHQAKVEDKPEVKKAGGVFYTPTYIVDYIVKNTIGKLLEDKTPKQAAALRILDPACGSGSFLIGAYQYLLDWHREWYSKNWPEKWSYGGNPTLYKARAGEYRLTTPERKRILLNNIYGVDIDTQAVEVTKLSLLLKVLEGENEQSISQQLKLFHQRALPDLGNNIKCGNSLIGMDFYDGVQETMALYEDAELEDRIKVNAFDWDLKHGFQEIMKSGGFDAVIGNPPYGADIGEKEEDYFCKKYSMFAKVKDVYAIFIEKALWLLRREGKLSFIVPSAWCGGPAYIGLRELLLTTTIENILLLPFDVFKDAYVDTAVFVLTKMPSLRRHNIKTHVFKKKEKLISISLDNSEYQAIPQEDWRKTEGKRFILKLDSLKIISSLRAKIRTKLEDVITMRRGVLFDKSLLTARKSNQSSFPYFEGDVLRYHLHFAAPHWVVFDERIKERPRDFCWFEGERILLRRLVNRRFRLMATLIQRTCITNKNLYTVLAKPNICSLLLILGVLNSKLLSYLYVNQITQATKDDFPQVTINDILGLPFPLDTSNVKMETQAKHLVSIMIDLCEKLPLARTEQEKIVLSRQITSTDRRIDDLVYELYGLTKEEIKIVEGASEGK
jgi:type I restriction-modification system DNA methylase subunit/predicted type IV restriction endonuclease